MHRTKHYGWWYEFSPCWLLLWLFIASGLGAEQSDTATAETMHGTDFVLTRHGSLYSLHAQQASLREILEGLGRLLASEVVVRIPRDTKISLDFDRLPLTEAIQRLRAYANIVYLTDTKQPSGKITRMIIIPRQGGESISQPMPPQGAAPPPTSRTQPAPFKFEFDPSTSKEGRQ